MAQNRARWLAPTNTEIKLPTPYKVQNLLKSWAMPAAVSRPAEHISQAEGCYISFSASNSCHDFDQRKLLLLKPRRNGRFILNSTTDNSNQKRHLLIEPECLRLITSNILVCSNSWYWPAYLELRHVYRGQLAASKERRPAVSVWRKQLIPACAIRGSW